MNIFLHDKIYNQRNDNDNKIKEGGKFFVGESNFSQDPVMPPLKCVFIMILWVFPSNLVCLFYLCVFKEDVL